CRSDHTRSPAPAIDQATPPPRRPLRSESHHGETRPHAIARAETRSPENPWAAAPWPPTGNPDIVLLPLAPARSASAAYLHIRGASPFLRHTAARSIRPSEALTSSRKSAQRAHAASPLPPTRPA